MTNQKTRSKYGNLSRFSLISFNNCIPARKANFMLIILDVYFLIAGTISTFNKLGKTHILAVGNRCKMYLFHLVANLISLVTMHSATSFAADLCCLLSAADKVCLIWPFTRQLLSAPGYFTDATCNLVQMVCGIFTRLWKVSEPCEKAAHGCTLPKSHAASGRRLDVASSSLAKG